MLKLAAAEWRLSGDVDRAVREYETVTSVRLPEVPVAWFLLAEARLEQQLRKPSAETRDWRGVEAALRKARVDLGDTPGIVLLQATAAIARNSGGACVPHSPASFRTMFPPIEKPTNAKRETPSRVITSRATAATSFDNPEW